MTMEGAEVIEYLFQDNGKPSCSPAPEYGSRWAWVLLPGSPTDFLFSASFGGVIWCWSGPDEQKYIGVSAPSGAVTRYNARIRQVSLHVWLVSLLQTAR